MLERLASRFCRTVEEPFRGLRYPSIERQAFRFQPLLSDLLQQVTQPNWCTVFGATRERWGDSKSLVMILKPDQKRCFLCSDQPLLIDPCVISPHIRIDQGPLGVSDRSSLPSGYEFLHGLLVLSRCESG